MPPRTRRKIAASRNYRKQKGQVRCRDESRGVDRSASGEEMVEGGLKSVEARVQGGLWECGGEG